MNALKATILSIEHSDAFALVSLSCSTQLFHALIIDHKEEYIKEGNTVWMAFKETGLSLAKNLTGDISIRNRFPSVITAIHKNTLLSEIVMNYNGMSITSVITTASCERLQLAIGTEVEGLLKTTELMLMKHD